jgi:hypothetical protein
MPALSTALLIERPLIYSSLYDLATVVFASQGLSKLSTSDENDEFDKLRLRHEVAKATKILIEIAVVLRNLSDGGNWPMDVIHEARVSARLESSVGILQENGKPDIDLRFREACNKLIHADCFEFGMSSVEGKMAFLNGLVQLHGKRSTRTWVAEIRISDFIRMAVRQL